MKIQESSYHHLNLSNINLAKKISASPIAHPENAIDTHEIDVDPGIIEKGVFQTLKAIISDFRNSIERLCRGDQNITFHDIQIQISENFEIMEAEHTILILFVSGKGEIPENPVKIFFSYNSDKPSSEIPVSPQFVRKVVEEARRFVGVLMMEDLFAMQDTEKEDTNSVSESGFIINFSYIPRELKKEPTGTSGLIAFHPAQKEAMTVHELTNTYHVSGKAIDIQYFSFLSIHTEEENEVLKNLPVFFLSRQSDAVQTEVNGVNVISQKDRIVEQIGKKNNAIELKKIWPDLPFQSFNVENNSSVTSLDILKNKDGMTPVLVMSATNANELIGDQEGESGGTTLNTGFGQGELKSSPVAGSPLLRFDNNIIMSKIVTFVERLNILLSGNGTVDEVLDETMTGGSAPSYVSPEKLCMLQMRSPEVRIAIQNIGKKIFAEFENIPDIQLTGLSPGKNGSLHLDTSALVSQLTSNKEETINGMKGLGNTLYERINYLLHPYTGMYLDDKNIFQLRATRKDEGASLPDRESHKEQRALEKRLNELKLLIDRSRVLTEWFIQNDNISADNPEEASGGI